MRRIRHDSRPLAALMLVSFVIGMVAFPTLHRLDHAGRIAAKITASDAHDHSDHEKRFEDSQDSLTADSCWICARQFNSKIDLLASADVHLLPERVEFQYSDIATLTVVRGGHARAPPILA